MLTTKMEAVMFAELKKKKKTELCRKKRFKALRNKTHPAQLWTHSAKHKRYELKWGEMGGYGWDREKREEESRDRDST